MQSLGMLLYTEGKERTLGEYEALLKQVGFAEVSGARRRRRSMPFWPSRLDGRHKSGSPTDSAA